MRSKGNDNGGFTLVELLVAMAILVIVVVPLLHSFVTGARLNAKSKRVMEATTVAQNVMETMKASSFNDLMMQNVTVTDEDGNTTQEKLVKDHGDGTYTITYDDMTVDKKIYKAQVKLDTNGYSAATGEALKYNDVALADIYKMDSAYDAFYAVTNSDDVGQAKRFTEDGSAYMDMDRTIIADISKTGNTVEVDISVQYSYQGTQTLTVANNCVYKNIEGELQLRNLYLLFDPLYNSNGRTDIKENVEIHNQDNVPVNVFLVKQENSNSTDLNELKYAVHVDVKENRSDLKDTEMKPVTVIRTNLLESQLKLTYGGQNQKVVGSRSYTARELLGLNTLSGSLINDRLFQVEVSVYDENNKKLVSIDGTKEK